MCRLTGGSIHSSSDLTLASSRPTGLVGTSSSIDVKAVVPTGRKRIHTYHHTNQTALGELRLIGEAEHTLPEEYTFSERHRCYRFGVMCMGFSSSSTSVHTRGNQVDGDNMMEEGHTFVEVLQSGRSLVSASAKAARIWLIHVTPQYYEWTAWDARSAVPACATPPHPSPPPAHSTF